MIKKTITYHDYNGVERTENFYFNLNKAELMKMEMSIKGGMIEMMERVVAAKDAPAIIAVFEDLIQRSYGVKTPDGRGFIKRASDLEDFMSTEAYSILFMELASDADAAAKFFNGVISADVANNVTNHPALKN